MATATEMTSHAMAPPPGRTAGRRTRGSRGSGGSPGSRRRPYLILTATLLLSAAPLYFMVVMASRKNDEITSVPPPLLPGGQAWTNVDRVLSNADVMFGRAVLNSLLVAGTTTVSVVVFASLAGFAFAKLRFRGKQGLLLLVIATMMVPVQLGLIPLYMLMTRIHLAGGLPSVILPFLVSGFGVFMMRQFVAQSIPDEMIEAARLDGASTWRIFVYVVFPVLRPAAAVLGLLTFMERWNDFLWPYLSLDLDHPTVQVALSRLASGYYTDQSLVMAGTLLGTVPLVLVFVFFGRQIIGGIMEGGVKS